MDELLDQQGLEAYLKHHGLPLLDRFGQNFLIDHNVLEQIVSAVNPDPKIPIIEIGAGLGVLTCALARRRLEIGNGKQEPLFAFELDRRLIPLLNQRIKNYPNIKVINQDILNFYPALLEKLPPTPYPLLPSEALAKGGHPPYDIAGNIPYNITSKLIRHILAWKPKPRAITFLIDAEVAKRVTALPGEMSILAVSVQVFAEPMIIGPVVMPTAFVPQPKVKSAILRMETRKEPLVPEELQKEFFSLVKGGFAQKRKTLQNSLRALWHCSGEEAAEVLKRAKIDPTQRAQTLSIEEWLRILVVKK